MKERTNDVLLQYFEQTLSDRLTLHALLRAASDAFIKLLDANAVYFFTEKGTWLRPEEITDGKEPPNYAQRLQEGGWPAAPPERGLMKEIETCLAKKAGRSVCVCKKDAAGMAWWLFWLKEGETVCGAAVCAAPEPLDEEALSGAHRLARCIAPRFAALEKKQREQSLLSLSGSAATMLSHEFKTPLTVALSSLQLLRRTLIAEDGTVPERAEKYIDYTELNLYKALRIATNLVDAQYDRPDDRVVKTEYTDLGKRLAELADSAKPYAEITGAQLIFENRAGERCGLVCNVFYLERILLNLLSNALKHAPPGSSVRIVLEQKDDALLIHVEDEGEGIPDEVRDRLFQKFWRGPKERTGTGLGLYLSRCFAGEMGGTLQAENRPQGGARFTLCLPRTAEMLSAVSGDVLRGAPAAYSADSRNTLLQIEFSELLSQKCI